MTRDGTKRLKRAALCLTCEGDIDPDERVHVEPGVGAWHFDCDPPRNLSLYRRERDRAKTRRPRLRDIEADYWD